MYECDISVGFGLLFHVLPSVYENILICLKKKRERERENESERGMRKGTNYIERVSTSKAIERAYVNIHTTTKYVCKQKTKAHTIRTHTGKRRMNEAQQEY